MSEQAIPAQKAYTSLANKYRPQTFEEVVGQDSVSKTLMNAVKSGRISHAYLFYGPRGCGKTTSARLLAKALNCTGGADPSQPNPTPCGVCPQCREIAASSDLDVLELDAASNTQVEKVREAIIETVSLAAGRDRFKIFILDEVHMLSTSSFNALLKTIEEPPAHVVFILATTELHKVPLTISSRCQTFRFKPIDDKQTQEHLLDLAEAEGIELEPAAANIISANAGGAMRDALTILDRAIAYSGNKITEASLAEMLGLMPKELVQKAAVALVEKDSQSLHKVFETVKTEGFDSVGLLKDLKKAFGDIFYFSLKAAPEPFEGAGALLSQTSPAFIAGLTRKISKLIDEVRFSDTPLLLAEVGLFTIMESSLDLEQFINRLTDLENALENGVPALIAEKKTLNNPQNSDFIEEDVPIPSNPFADSLLAPQTDAPISAPAPVAIVKPVPLPAAPAEVKPMADFDERQKWEDCKKELGAKFPFLYQNILDADIAFLEKDIWQLSYPADEDFAMGSVKRRAADLEAAALKVCGVPVKFNFKLDGEKRAPAYRSPKTPSVPKAAFQKPDNTFSKQAVAERTSVAKHLAPSSAQPKTSVYDNAVISSEKPFTDGDFSQDYVPSASVKTSVAEATPIQNKENAPAEDVKIIYSTQPTKAAQKIMEFIEGSLVEEL